ncbi:MAG: hypothetical protein FGF48_05545, partial [Candidatus Brockarchaeota archaeon]|nr:hypothetical protein [Candidatus Brockarchaeota archaeon]
ALPALRPGNRVLRPSILEPASVKWNLREFSIPAEEKSVRAGRREIIKDESLFHKLAEKYVKTVKSRLELKLDYSLSSLRSLDNVSRILRHGVQDPAKLQKDSLATHLLQTGSYLGETIVRSLNGKWVKAENPVGWTVSLDGEKIDVFQIVLESIFMPNRFNELFEKLTIARKREDSSED